MADLNINIRNISLDENKPYFREFKLNSINCVSVYLNGRLKGFYVGVMEDYLEGFVEEQDLIPTAKELKIEINKHLEL